MCPSRILYTYVSKHMFSIHMYTKKKDVLYFPLKKFNYTSWWCSHWYINSFRNLSFAAMFYSTEWMCHNLFNLFNQAPLKEHPGCFQSFALPSEERFHSALGSDSEACRVAGPERPCIESPLLCFSSEQLDRPLESSQLFL